VRHHLTHHAWDHFAGAIDRMSAFKVAAWGGTGSIGSYFAATTVPDFTTLNAWSEMILRTATATGACLSVGLLVFKGVLMWHHRDKPPR